jgi:secreted Zn-dependent insulinase-like peptidase
MAEQMTRLPKEDLLTGDYLIKQPDPSIVKDMMKMLEPSKMNVAFVDPNFDESEGVIELPHYGVKYTLQDLSKRMPVAKQWATWVNGPASTADVNKAMLQELQKMDANITTALAIKHPEPIKHIPGDITLQFAQAPPGQNEISSLYGAQPKQMATKSPKEQIWYRQGSTSQSPKVHMKFLTRRAGFRTINSKEVIQHSIWRRMIGEQLHPKLVDLAATGTSYAIDVGSHSLSVSFGGFKDNLPAMMELVTQEMQNGVDITETARFNRIKETLAEELEDKSEMPVQYAIEDRAIMLMQGTHSDDELRAALDVVHPADLKDAQVAGIEDKPTQFTALAMGNLQDIDAMQTTQKYLSSMNFNLTLADDQTELVAPVLHPKAPLELRKLNPRPNDPNHVTVVSILAGVPDVIDSVVWSIIGQVLGPVAYDELRTRKQLGYVVQGGVGKLSSVLVLNVVVQGKEVLPDETEAMIDMVLTKLMPERLLGMTTEEFESYKEATAKAFLKPPLGFSDEVNQYWPSVAAKGQCFEKRHDELEYLRTQLTNKRQLIDAYMNVVLPKNKAVRSRLAIKYWSQEVEGGIPARPDFKARQKLMEDAGVPTEGIKQAEVEHKETQVFDKADSGVRGQLSRKYGHFSEELKCRSSIQQKEEAVQEDEQDLEAEKVRQEDSPQQGLGTDSAKVAVGNHDNSQVVVEDIEKSTVHSPSKRKKRADSSMSIDSGARLSVDQVVRGES